jgi:hypothetical protein
MSYGIGEEWSECFVVQGPPPAAASQHCDAEGDVLNGKPDSSPGCGFTELRFNGYRLRRQAMVASRLVPLGPSLSMTSASREVLIGGGPALHKGPALPRWRVCTVFASRAEPESENSDLRSMTCRSAECPHSSD